MEKRLYIKEPGSAITHFIGMIMAIIAAIPLLYRAAREPSKLYIVSLTIYAASLILLYAASTTYHTFDISEKVNTVLKEDRSHDDLRSDCRKLHTCLPVSNRRTQRYHTAMYCMGIRDCRHPYQSLLGILSEMGIFRFIHWHGMDLRACIFYNP